MYLNNNILIFVLISFVASSFSSNSSLLKFKDCVDACKRGHPRVGIRFTDYQLDMWCQDMDHWYTELLKPKKIYLYTRHQLEYLQLIRSCTTNEECYIDKEMSGKTRRSTSKPSLRKECRAMTKDEFGHLMFAFNKLKSTKIDGMNKYDLLITYHDPKAAPGAHFGPAFLPFHREYLKQLEVALRREHPKAHMCYWDTNLDQGLPNPVDSIVWTPDLFGSSDGPIIEGPFAYWVATSPYPGADDNLVYRGVGNSDAWDLYNEQDLEFILSKNYFKELASYCTEPIFTVLHNSVHEFVGGHMLYTPISPNDPVFFFHHAYVDYLWENWRLRKQTPDQREQDYPAEGPDTCGSHHYGSAPMLPFRMKNIDGLSTKYDKMFKYTPAPTCESGCSGPFLYCDTIRRRCISKIRLNGNCKGFEDFDICYKSVCVNGVCIEGRFQKLVGMPREWQN